VSRTRTYPHVYQQTLEALKKPGTTRFVFEGFEGLDPRWATPTASPDLSGDTDMDSSRALVTKPAGVGAPASSTNAMQVTFDFESASGNKLFFRHEILSSPNAASVTDHHAGVVVVDQNTAFIAQLYTPAAYSGRQVRMVAMDANGQLEMSSPYTLNATGWREIVWDLTDASQIHAYDTNEQRNTNTGAYYDGDGVLDSAGNGTRDIAFVGFVIEGGGAGSGNVVFDELAYERRTPGGSYVINEFRYGQSGTQSHEFIEIYGPAGPFPSGMEIRVYDSSNGSVAKTIALSGSISDYASSGFGYYVVGDPGVPNVNSTTGFTGAGDDLPDTAPTGIQLYSSSTGAVYDNVVYRAWGGLKFLARLETKGVTGHGWPWLGAIANGLDSTGQPYTMGRYPDGEDTTVNFDDFTAMIASPGAPNGGAITADTTIKFDSTPTQGFLTFQSASSGAMASNVGPSPSGGNVYRVVDTTGGGTIAFFGDAALGADGKGYRVTGEVFIPNSAANGQAIGLGICGKQGTTFFSASPANSGYESGYWLIYENKNGLGLNDGRPDHGETFEFVYATHDNMDSTPVTLLGSASAASLGLTPGNWTTFELSISPIEDALVAKINGNTVYSGSIPTGGPTSGAFQAGFRAFTSVTSTMGTWIDNLNFELDLSPDGLLVYVDGTGAPDTPGGPYSKLSLAMAYVNANSDPSGNIIRFRTNSAPDDTQIRILVPVTIIGDGETVPDGTPASILVNTSDTTGIGAATDIGQTGKYYIEIDTAGDVVIHDLILHPNTNGNTSTMLIDAIGMFKPTSGTGNYTLERVWASASNSSNAFLDPETATDIYYASSVRRWYAYDHTRGIFNLTNSGGAGSYNATLTDCKAGAARSHGLNIQNQSGTTTINRGVYAYNGQDNIRISGTGVTLQGTDSSRLRATNASRSSAGESIRVLAGATVTKMEYVDSIGGTNGASGFAFSGGTTTLMRYCRAGGNAGAQIYISGSANVTAESITAHGAANSPLTFSGYSGTASFTDSVFGSTAANQIVISGGTTHFAYCAIPTDGGAETLNTTNPFSAAPTSNTNSISASPQFVTTTFTRTNSANVDYLRPGNTSGPYSGTGSLGQNLTGGAAGTTLPVELDLFQID
jgi:hypothetical protein